jgi:hypothetical protein
LSVVRTGHRQMLYSARSLDSRLMEMVLLPYKLELLGSFRVVTESPASDGDRPRPSPGRAGRSGHAASGRTGGDAETAVGRPRD